MTNGTLQSREDEIEFCKAHGIDLPFGSRPAATAVTETYGISAMKDLELENPANAPNYDHLLDISVLHLKRLLMKVKYVNNDI